MQYELIRVYKWFQKECLNPKADYKDRYYEVPYFEYSIIDGEMYPHQSGTEDFTYDRLKSMRGYAVKTWNGESYNKGGHKWWDDGCDVYAMSAKEARLYAEHKYANEAVEIRLVKFK